MGRELAAFVGVCVLVIVTPGQDTVLVIRNALLGGRRGGVFTALGVATGQAVWTLVASLGIAALLAASEPAFAAVKLAGAAYMVVLGAHALLGAVRGGGPDGRAGGPGSSRPVTPPVALRQGVISNLGNPKSAVFFTSLLPQFAPGGDASFTTMLTLGLVYCALTLLWLTGYGVAVAKVGDVLRRPKIRRAIDGLTGAVLVGFGLRLATEQR
jgi:threonine/homoserine/homoserine lactone efflux protein